MKTWDKAAIQELVARNLRAIMQGKEITIAELAKMTELTVQQITLLLTAGSFVSSASLARLCNALEVDLTALFREDV